MKAFRRIFIGLALAAAVSGAGAQSADDLGTSLPAPFGIGEVTIDDPRIVDISGTYSVGGTTVTLVQDGRGRLTGTITAVLSDGTEIGPVRASGFVSVQLKKTTRFRLAGKVRLPDGNGRRSLQIRYEGTLEGDAFQVDVIIKGKGRPTKTSGVLVPENPERGAIVSNGQAQTSSTATTLYTTCTVTLPWGTVEATGVETVLDASGREHFRVTSNDRSSMAPGGRFRLDLKGRADAAAGTFTVRSSKVQVGYGHIDATATTTVAPALPTGVE